MSSKRRIIESDDDDSSSEESDDPSSASEEEQPAAKKGKRVDGPPKGAKEVRTESEQGSAVISLWCQKLIFGRRGMHRALSLSLEGLCMRYAMSDTGADRPVGSCVSIRENLLVGWDTLTWLTGAV